MPQIRKVEFVKAVYCLKEAFPEPKEGDVAFVGRSNVGKSTLLNVLFGRKLAHVSKRPGKTRSINFYLVNSSFYMVDLPGYGYAQVSKEEREKWGRLVAQYFEKRWSLKLVCILVDGRHGLQERDRELVQWLSQFDVPYLIILTKMDKVKRSEKMKKIREVENDLEEFGEYLVIPYSAVTHEGVEEILNNMFTAVEVR